MAGFYEHYNEHVGLRKMRAFLTGCKTSLSLLLQGLSCKLLGLPLCFQPCMAVRVQSTNYRIMTRRSLAYGDKFRRNKIIPSSNMWHSVRSVHRYPSTGIYCVIKQKPTISSISLCQMGICTPQLIFRRDRRTTHKCVEF